MPWTSTEGGIMQRPMFLVMLLPKGLLKCADRFARGPCTGLGYSGNHLTSPLAGWCDSMQRNCSGRPRPVSRLHTTGHLFVVMH